MLETGIGLLATVQEFYAINCLALLAFAGSNTPYMPLRIKAAVLSAPKGVSWGLVTTTAPTLSARKQ